MSGYNPMPKHYKLCPQCGQPILKPNQKRQHPDDYRHASGCPLDDDERKSSTCAISQTEPNA